MNRQFRLAMAISAVLTLVSGALSLKGWLIGLPFFPGLALALATVANVHSGASETAEVVWSSIFNFLIYTGLFYGVAKRFVNRNPAPRRGMS